MVGWSRERRGWLGVSEYLFLEVTFCILKNWNLLFVWPVAVHAIVWYCLLYCILINESPIFSCWCRLKLYTTTAMNNMTEVEFFNLELNKGQWHISFSSGYILASWDTKLVKKHASNLGQWIYQHYMCSSYFLDASKCFSLTFAINICFFLNCCSNH